MEFSLFHKIQCWIQLIRIVYKRNNHHKEITIMWKPFAVDVKVIQSAPSLHYISTIPHHCQIAGVSRSTHHNTSIFIGKSDNR